MRFHNLCWIAALCVFVAGSSRARSQGNCPAIPNPPSDLSLNLKLDHGQTLFRQGEIIALTAGYSSTARGKYLFNNRSYDRSGRLDGMEVFCIEPSPGTDPLQDYFNSLSGFIGGGMSSEQEVTRAPIPIKLELNEWHSLPPGTYKVSIVGYRVSVGDERNMKSWNDKPVPIRSNAVVFQVVNAEPAWQDAQLPAAVSVLNSRSASDEQKWHAARVLRFLGSETSTRELAKRYWNCPENLCWTFESGLFGSPYWGAAIQEMRNILKYSQGPAREEFVRTLVRLELQSDPTYRIGPYHGEGNRARVQELDAFEAESKRRVAAYMAASGANQNR